MTNAGFITSAELLAKELKDAEFRAAWEASAPARAIAIRIIEYRIDNELSQTALGRLLGMSQPAVARLEIGKHLPTLTTLRRISEALGIEILVSIHPAGRTESWVSPSVEKTAKVIERVTSASGSELLVAAS